MEALATCTPLLANDVVHYPPCPSYEVYMSPITPGVLGTGIGVIFVVGLLVFFTMLTLLLVGTMADD